MFMWGCRCHIEDNESMEERDISFVNGDCWFCIHLDLKVVQSKGYRYGILIYEWKTMDYVNVISSLNFPTLRINVSRHIIGYGYCEPNISKNIFVYLHWKLSNSGNWEWSTWESIDLTISIISCMSIVNITMLLLNKPLICKL